MGPLAHGINATSVTNVYRRLESTACLPSVFSAQTPACYDLRSPTPLLVCESHARHMSVTVERECEKSLRQKESFAITNMNIQGRQYKNFRNRNHHCWHRCCFASVSFDHWTRVSGCFKFTRLLAQSHTHSCPVLTDSAFTTLSCVQLQQVRQPSQVLIPVVKDIPLLPNPSHSYRFHLHLLAACAPRSPWTYQSTTAPPGLS